MHFSIKYVKAKNFAVSLRLWWRRPIAVSRATADFVQQLKSNFQGQCDEFKFLKSDIFYASV